MRSTIPFVICLLGAIVSGAFTLFLGIGTVEAIVDSNIEAGPAVLGIVLACVFGFMFCTLAEATEKELDFLLLKEEEDILVDDIYDEFLYDDTDDDDFDDDFDDEYEDEEEDDEECL